MPLPPIVTPNQTSSEVHSVLGYLISMWLLLTHNLGVKRGGEMAVTFFVNIFRYG